MGILFSFGNMGDPLYLLDKMREFNPSFTLGTVSDLRYEVSRFKAWHKDEVDKIVRVSESGGLDSLIECQDQALQFEAALTYTMANTSRSRLSDEARVILEREVAESIELLKSASDLIKRRIEALKTNPSNDVPPINRSSGLSYSWLYEDHIELLYNQMSGIWIAADTGFESFEAVFAQKPLSQIIPIGWIGTAGSLLYFLCESMRNKLLYQDGSTFSYLQLKACFRKGDRSEFTQNLKQIKAKEYCGASKNDVNEIAFILDSLPR